MTNSQEIINNEKDLLIIVPAHNEADNLEHVISSIKIVIPDGDILIIDDGSIDETFNIAKKGGVKVLKLPFNLGVGTALQTGYKYAFENGYEFLIQLDGDCQHDPKYLPAILKKLDAEKFDFVIGSRWLKKGEYQGGRFRKLGNLFFAKILSVLIREKLTDPTSGFRGMNRKVLKFCVSDIYQFDYPDADFLLTLHRAGFKFCEVPITFNKRKNGVSQHVGLKPVFYIIKMFLSLFIILLRKRGK
jgi:glycosyltransferase involved in cell wall biosynthesis